MTTGRYLWRTITVESDTCLHCSHTGGTTGGMVVLDQRTKHGHEISVPCPMCEAGEIMALSWQGTEGQEFWSLPGWDARAYTWNGGLTLKHVFQCPGQCSGVQTHTHLCGSCAQGEGSGVPVPRVRSVPARREATT